MPYAPSVTVVPVASATSRTATSDFRVLRNRGHRGVRVRVNVSAITATPSVVFKIQGQHPVTGAWSDLLASAAVVAAGETVLTVYPGLTAAANSVASAPMPKYFRVRAEHADADAITYRVDAELLV